MDKGAYVTLTCKANEPIYWIDITDKFPLLWTVIFAWDFNVSQVYMIAAKLHEGKFQIQYEKNSTDDKHYTKLVLSNVDHRSIGRYYCAKNSTSISEVTDLLYDESLFKSVYLYVKGEIFYHLKMFYRKI